MDHKICDYLDNYSTSIQPKSSVEIANAINIPAEDTWQRCIFLAQKGIIQESGMGLDINSCRYYR